MAVEVIEVVVMLQDLVVQVVVELVKVLQIHQQQQEDQAILLQYLLLKVIMVVMETHNQLIQEDLVVEEELVQLVEIHQTVLLPMQLVMVVMVHLFHLLWQELMEQLALFVV